MIEPDEPQRDLENPGAVPEIGKPGAGPSHSRAAEPVAVILASDIVRWTIATISKFPRNLRYGLGSRIESALTDVLEHRNRNAPSNRNDNNGFRVARSPPAGAGPVHRGPPGSAERS